MVRLVAIAAGAGFALIVALTLLYLTLVDIPAPTQKVEKVVPDARLPH